MIKTTTAQAASVERSAVGLRRPIKLMRFEITLVENSAATKGISFRNFSPALPMTNLLAVSTKSSATACRLEIFSTFRSWVSQIHRPVIIAMTSQLITRVSLICRSPSTGMPVGIVKKTRAPEISTSIHFHLLSLLYF